MKYYSKKTKEIYDLTSESSNNKIIQIIHFTEFKKKIYNIYDKYNFEKCIIQIENIDQIIYLQQLDFFCKIKNILINYDLVEHEEIHLLYFIDKNCFILDDNNLCSYKYKKILTNPLLSGIFNINESFIDYNINNNIINEVCHINIKKICEYYNINLEVILIDSLNDLLYGKINPIFNCFLIYNIYGFPPHITDETIINIYTNLVSKIGDIFKCHPVNDKTTNKSTSRAIKYDKDTTTLHFFSSNSKQPLHNDYAYYEQTKKPNWLAIFSLKSAEYGGVTSFITNNKLKTILEKYDCELLSKITTKLTYVYNDIDCENIVHTKQLFNIKNNISNWNYFQIKPEYNTTEVMNIKEDFFNFLNKNITDARVNTISKVIQRGECIIFNDMYVMHERSSFLGDRHLQDIAFYLKN